MVLTQVDLSPFGPNSPARPWYGHVWQKAGVGKRARHRDERVQRRSWEILTLAGLGTVDHAHVQEGQEPIGHTIASDAG